MFALNSGKFLRIVSTSLLAGEICSEAADQIPDLSGLRRDLRDRDDRWGWWDGGLLSFRAFLLSRVTGND